MIQHFLMRLFRVFRFVNAYQFHFREFMQTVQATYIFSIRTGFTTETLGISTVLNRQLFLIQNHVAINICYRNLCCRNQIQIIQIAVIHLAFLIRQLSGAITRSSIYYCRRHDFFISGSTSFIKEEVNQSTLQTSSLSFINRESGTCNLYTQVKIY